MSDYDSLKSHFENLGGAMHHTEAFYTILAAAVAADGETHPTEVDERDALVHRVKTLSVLRDADPSQLANIRRRADDRIANAKSLDDIVTDAASTIANDPKNKDGGMAWSVYAHAGDIIFADSKVVQREIEFLIRLAEHLKLPPSEAGAILDFLKKKNSF